MKPGGRSSPAKASDQTRREEALRLRIRGLSFDAIGKHLGITRQSAHELVTRALEASRTETKQLSADVIELELHRLDELLTFANDAVQSGDVTAIDRALRIMERRAKLLGLDAASKSEVSGPDGGPIATTAHVVLMPPLESDEPSAEEPVDAEREPG